MDVFDIYKDKKQARFWEKTGEEFGYLHWVRAMILKDADAQVEIPEIKINFPGNYFDNSKIRAEIYGLLSEAYSEPTQEFAEEVMNGKFYEKLKNCFSIIGIKIDEIPEKYGYSDLLEDYTGIFLEPSMPFIPAYESIYRSEKQVMGNTTVIVKKFYENCGFKSSIELPDHISNELKFMEFLCKNKDEEIQGKFLSEHLLEWAHNFCDDLSKVADTGFYFDTAKITKIFTGMEKFAMSTKNLYQKEVKFF
ncbi:hypothetical protein BEH94_08805 [Candidatus Altiarchaeales archaeon WOR_SM1_SCG]|nr:hypothetical protein BEH94_08805 [Candidatus Altiarchaeales archaeon WOR_SM1_SCG]